MMFTHTAAFFLGVSSFLMTVQVSAWTPASLARMSSARSRPSSSLSRRWATVESDVTTSTSSTTTTTLSPEFQAALTHAQDKIKSVIPQDKQAAFLPLLSHFVTEYITASQDAYLAGNTEECAPQTAAQRILNGIGMGLKFGVGPNKFQFDVSNIAMRGKHPEQENGNTMDFYQFGCDFFRPCMNLRDSVVLGQDNMARAQAQLDAGENVVYLANHQSEADPQVVSACFEIAGYGVQAADMVYVAGHKVTTDPLAIPFSMGRNLLCIHSKKHIDADPATKPLKQKQNLRAMSALLDRFKQGGNAIWVAPSGGRDRRDVASNTVPLAPFDNKTIDMFRLMANKSKVKTHFYTLAMVTYDLCPPPDFVDPGVGESRNVRYVPVGIAVGEECESVGGLECRKAFCQHAMDQCQADYEALLEQIQSKKVAATK
jgi:glycerol-3-phosphate O-acyltransferase